MNDKLKEMQTLDEVLSEHIDFNGSDYTLINPKSELKTDLEALIEQKVKLGRQEVIREIDEWLSLNSVLTDNKDFYKAFKNKLNNLKK